MLLTQESLDALRVTFSTAFMGASERTPTQYQNVCSTISSASSKNIYGWLAPQLVMREWIGPRVAQALSEHKFEVSNKRWENTIEIKEDELKDAGEGDLAFYTDFALPEIGESSAEAPDNEFVRVLQANPPCFDGQNLFANAHPSFAKSGTSTQSFDNDHALALTADNIDFLWTLGAQMPGEDGIVKPVMYDTLIVPPQLRRTAMEVLEATQTTKVTQNAAATDNVAVTTIDNVNKGLMNVMVVPKLANAGGTFYVAKLGGIIKPFVFQDREALNIVARMSPDDPRVFDEGIYTFGAKRRFAIAPTLPSLIQRSVAP